jgi:hypothetical protein
MGMKSFRSASEMRFIAVDFALTIASVALIRARQAVTSLSKKRAKFFGTCAKALKAQRRSSAGQSTGFLNRGHRFKYCRIGRSSSRHVVVAEIDQVKMSGGERA